MINLTVKNFQGYINSLGYNVAEATIRNHIKKGNLRILLPKTEPIKIIMDEIAQNWTPPKQQRPYKKNTTSQYNGVCYLKNTNNWRSYLRIGDKNKHIGVFETELEAYQARESFISNHFKENGQNNDSESFSNKDLLYYV